MNIKQLEVFMAVAETGSFSKGAEASFITQSTVSQHISALEIEVGLKLLDRTGKGALLTEAGKVFLRHARQVIANMEEIHRAINRFKGLEEAFLKVGGSNIPGTYMIPEILAKLAGQYPGITVTVMEGDSRDILAKIKDDQVEIGIVGSRFPYESIVFTPFGEEEIRLIVRKDHRWSRQSFIKPEELLTEPMILRESGSGTGKTVSEALLSTGISPEKLKIRAYLGSNEAIKHAIQSGLGVSFLSEISVRKELERGEIHAVDVEGVTINRHFYLAHRIGRELSPAAAAFKQMILSLYEHK